MIVEFPHKAPKGYSYEFEKDFKRNITAIWLHHHCKYDYNLGKPVRTIWGFYNYKKKQYFSPINSKTIGNLVNIEDTRPHTAMPLKLTILLSCFV
jgi:hypothetical protein